MAYLVRLSDILTRLGITGVPQFWHTDDTHAWIVVYQTRVHLVTQ